MIHDTIRYDMIRYVGWLGTRGASLGTRGARGDGLVVVFWASLVVVAESPRVAVGHPATRNGEGGCAPT